MNDGFWDRVFDLTKTAGIPAVFTGVILYGVWRSVSWLGEVVLRPLAVHLVQAIDVLSATMHEIAGTQVSITKVIEAMKDNHELRDVINRHRLESARRHEDADKRHCEVQKELIALRMQINGNGRSA